MNKFPLKAICVAVLLCSAAAAEADIVVYTSEAAFLAAVTNPGTDSYEDLVFQPYQSPMERAAGPYSYLASSGPNESLFIGGIGGGGCLSAANPFDSIVFSGFSGGVSAVGGFFYGAQVTDPFFVPGSSVTLTAYDGSTLSYSVTENDSTEYTFLGFVSSSPLTSVVLSPDGSGRYLVTAESLTLAMAVPEPETYGMLMAGLCLLGAIAGRRRA